MKYYIRQKFLWFTPDYDKERLVTVKTSLDAIQKWGGERNLFDCGAPLVRRITVCEMDDSIDTEEEWERFVVAAQKVDLLYIETSEAPQNPIVRAYRLATLQAYSRRLRDAGVAFKFVCAA